MDTTPIYELRARLRTVCIAGTSLLSEDFRLKRAYETFKPLEGASPVFAKLGQLTAQLFSPNCTNLQGALLDAITLADAVICTLGVVDTQGEMESLTITELEPSTDNIVVNAPYSVLKELIDALTTSGGGHYGYVCEMHDSHPELFRDYRVKYTLVQALGASYAELADKVEEWLRESNDKTILPLLYKDFDPKGKKEMVRRVRLISALAGANANDFYVKMLKEAQREVRTELIDALRHDPGNTSLLFALSRTEKGKNRDKVFELIAGIQDEEVNNFFKELAKKKLDIVLIYLRNSTTDWSSDLVAEICEKILEDLKLVDDNSDKEKQEVSDRLQLLVRAIFGKGGPRICECYRKLLANKEKIDMLLKKTWRKPQNVYYYDVLQYGVLQSCRYWYKSEERDIETALGKILHHSLLVNPDPDLQALAYELYQSADSKKTNLKFLPAAVTVQFCDDEDCTEWLEQQVKDKILFVPKFSKERMKAVTEAAAYIRWSTTANSYEFFGSYMDDRPEVKSITRPIRLSHAKEIVEWFQKHSSKVVDEMLAYWIPLKDKCMCNMMGEYFYRKALITGDNRMYLSSMKACGWTVCEGLAIHYCKSKERQISQWELYNYLAEMPGDREAKRAEAQKLKELIRTGEINPNKIDTLSFDVWIEKNL